MMQDRLMAYSTLSPMKWALKVQSSGKRIQDLDKVDTVRPRPLSTNLPVSRGIGNISL